MCACVHVCTINRRQPCEATKSHSYIRTSWAYICGCCKCRRTGTFDVAANEVPKSKEEEEKILKIVKVGRLRPRPKNAKGKHALCAFWSRKLASKARAWYYCCCCYLIHSILVQTPYSRSPTCADVCPLLYVANIALLRSLWINDG